MKYAIVGVLGLLIPATSIFAQVSPTPVINNEIKDTSSDRSRSIFLEQIKRKGRSPVFQESSKEQEIRFALIKADFETIQKLQAEIIKVYTTGKEINYQKISESAAEINKKAIRLESNLFGTKPDPEKKDKRQKTFILKIAIIELDKAIENFVESPVFKSNKLIGQNDAEKAQIELEKIIKISESLTLEAKKMD